MSTIVAVEKNGVAAISSDTMSSVGSERVVNAVGTHKVARVGGSYIGFCGLSIYRTILRDYLSRMKRSPQLKDETSILRFFVGFWQAMKDKYHFVDDKAEKDDETPFADLGANFLVANSSGLFVVREILSVSRFERYCAIGSGSSHAQGALEAMYDGRRNASQLAIRATEIALVFDRASGGEIETVEIKMGVRKRSKSSR